MRRRETKRLQRKQVGTPPGTLIHLGEKRVERSSLSLFQYDEKALAERQNATFEECRQAAADPAKVTWINMIGLHDVEQLQQIGDAFRIHPLVLEDILNTAQRPRVEDYGEYLYVAAKMIYRGGGAGGAASAGGGRRASGGNGNGNGGGDNDPGSNRGNVSTGRGNSGSDAGSSTNKDGGAGVEGEMHEIVSEQVTLILGRNFVLSFQEIEGDVFDPIRERLRAGKGRLRKMGADYLAYGLLDSIVDNYFVILEDMGEEIESLQELVLSRPTPEVLGAIHGAKSEMILLRKAIWPVRELVGGLQKSESPLIANSTDMYLRDLYEHSIQVIDMIETQRDTLSSSLDIYLSSVSNRMNEIMRVLTVIATLFIPLTFLVGIYGMNLKNMPELQWDYSYPVLWMVMIGIVAGMLAYFKRKRWF